jgi:hypothetical protein
MGDDMNFDIEQIKPETKFLIVRYDSKLFQSTHQRDCFCKELELIAKESGLKVVAIGSPVVLEQLTDTDLANLFSVKAQEYAGNESKYGPITGLSISGVADIPLEGTFLVDKGERIFKQAKSDDLTKYLKNNPHHSTVIPPATGVIKDIYGVVRATPDLIGEQDDSEEHY